MEISAKTKVFGVIGDPVEHSLSPTIHNAAFKHLGLNAVYVAFRVRRENLVEAVEGTRSLEIKGLNVTMPHKSAIIEYLDEIDPIAEFVGSVNTLLNSDGKLLGYNTDGIGALKALKENHVDLNGKKLLLLGAGGAAKAIAFQLAPEVEELRILNRNGEKAKQLTNLIKGRFNKEVLSSQLSPKMMKKWLHGADILVNATCVGMRPKAHQTLIKREWLKPEITVMDIVYDPVETTLIKDAKSAGAKVIYGTDMLLFQGATSFEIWWGQPAPINAMREALLGKLLSR